MVDRTKRYLLTFKSPIRWAVLALTIAVFLFCIEISLSCYSIYLSLVGGITVDINWLDTFFFVLAIIFAVLAVGMIPLMVFVIMMWLKAQEQEDSAIKQHLATINERVVELAQEIRQDRNERHTKH